MSDLYWVDDPGDPGKLGNPRNLYWVGDLDAPRHTQPLAYVWALNEGEAAMEARRLEISADHDTICCIECAG